MRYRRPCAGEQAGDIQAGVPDIDPVTGFLYCHEIWPSGLTGRLRDQLSSLQRKAILAMTGAFSTTNNLKLLDLIGVIEIHDEIACQAECRERDHEEDRKIKAGFLAGQRRRFQPRDSRASTTRARSRRDKSWRSNKEKRFGSLLTLLVSKTQGIEIFRIGKIFR